MVGSWSCPNANVPSADGTRKWIFPEKRPLGFSRFVSCGLMRVIRRHCARVLRRSVHLKTVGQ